ncbi:ABC transporter permease [Paenibacillus sp. YPG26]|uniref:ABC transporter permease n=1 Tax=Paenibacillus sp. YPG26 TaxID=2878915 RepID=UPI00203B1750|nr:ABC transporter permease [Paenibacillus sp. YPG26]USB33455.1 ABC transporter permease [Paenibacillus sp. YPG26]
MNNIVSIAVKEIKHDFRDRRTLLFMLAFPIVLMLILGLALTNAFSSNVQLGEMKVLVKNSSHDGPLTEAFSAFTKEMKKSDIHFVPIQEGVNGMDEVRQNRYDGYMELTSSGISLYGNNLSAVEGNVIEGMLKAFTDKFNAVSAVAKVEPAKIQQVFAPGAAADGGYIKETSIDANRQPGSMDYYAVAMSVMIGLWGALSAGRLIRSEIVQGTAQRLIASPVRRSELFAGKVLGSIVQNFLCVLVVVLFSKYAFGAYWGEHLGIALIILLSEVIMSVSLGLGVSYLLNGKATAGVLMMFVQLASFFGGAYFPVSASGSDVTSYLVYLSPIRWANQALTELIYEQGSVFSAAGPAISLNMGLAVLMLALSAVFMRRKEGL